MLSTSQKYSILFVCLFIHSLLLNLFYLQNGVPIFYWDENLNLNAISTYLVSAILSVAFYGLLSHLRKLKNSGKVKVGDKGWLILSLFLLVSIVALLMM